MPDNPLFGQLVIDIVEVVPESDSVAARMLPELCERLRAVLVETSKADEQRLRAQLERMRGEHDLALKRLAELHALQNELADETSEFPLDRDAILDHLRIWHEEERKLEMNLAALRARQAALSQEIATIGESVETRLAQDPVIAELTRVVELRNEALKRAQMLVERGAANQEELHEVQEQLAFARAEAAERRMAAADSAGGGIVSALNGDLRRLDVDLAETESRLHSIQQRLADVRERDLLGRADRLERDVRLHLPMTREAVEMATHEIMALERRLRAFEPPVITVLGAGAEPEGGTPLIPASHIVRAETIQP